MAIQNRRGLKKDLDPTKMLPGEWAVTIDPETENQMVYMCFAPGVVKRMGTYEDFKEQIDKATAEIGADRDQIQSNTSDISTLQDSLNRALIISSDSGTTIVARDSAEFPLNGLALYGRSEQETTSGKNLFDIETARDINNYDLSLQGYGFCVLPIKVPSGSDITVSVGHTARTDDYLAFSVEYGADVQKNGSFIRM